MKLQQRLEITQFLFNPPKHFVISLTPKYPIKESTLKRATSDPTQTKVD